MDKITPKELEDNINDTPNKAPGISKINIAAIKETPEEYKTAILTIMNCSQNLAHNPKPWNTGIISITSFTL